MTSPQQSRGPRERAIEANTDARLAQLEALVSGQSETLGQLVDAVREIKTRLERRTPLPRMAAVDVTPMTDADMEIGGQYIFRVANPRRPFHARAMILGTTEDPKTGATLYRFVRTDTSRKFQPRPASEFFKLPRDWKDPTEDLGEEDDRPSTARPVGRSSSRPVTRR